MPRYQGSPLLAPRSNLASHHHPSIHFFYFLFRSLSSSSYRLWFVKYPMVMLDESFSSARNIALRGVTPHIFHLGIIILGVLAAGAFFNIEKMYRRSSARIVAQRDAAYSHKSTSYFVFFFFSSLVQCARSRCPLSVSSSRAPESNQFQASLLLTRSIYTAREFEF